MHRRLGIVVAILLLGAGPRTASTAVIADLSDPSGDDDGSGTYTYPTDAAFVPGVFDLTRLRVNDLGSSVRFECTISGPITNPWSSSSGFSLQSIDVYCDLDGISENGATWTPEGRHATFSSEAGWERCVWLAPAFDEFVSGVFLPDGSFVTDGVSVTLDAATHRLFLTAPKSLFPGISASSRFLALMLGQDGYSPGRVRPVEAAAGQWVFGGGASGTADANVLDVLGASGLSQRGMLGAYDPANGASPVLFFGPDADAPALAHTPPSSVLRAAPSLEATVSDRIVESAVLYARRRGAAAFDSTVLARASVEAPGTFLFRGAPAAAAVAGDTIQYFFRATDGLNASRLPADETFFSAPIDSVTPPPPVRRLDVIFLFHANQDLVPYAKVGDEACYLGLLQVLRNHPQSHFMLHWSGTLLHSLAWLRPASLEPLRQGIADGQFEMVGSTYAQNIMYSTRTDTSDTEMNRRQIREHRRILRSLLGVEPVSFWNCERVWTQSFVSLLREEGYRYAQIEDYALERSGAAASEYVLRTTRYGGDTLTVFDDDKEFEGLVNGAVDSGDDTALLAFLEALYQEDTGDRYAVCYHEDAEATGLWDYEGGGDPAANRAHLDALLTDLEARPWIHITTYSEFAASTAPAEDVTPVADAAADWMGRDAWFSENASPALDAYRALFDAVRDTLDAVEAEIDAHPGADSAAVSLHDQAWWTLCAHQYEFGVAGSQNVTNSAALDLCREALVPALAARFALDPYAARLPFSGDFDQDGLSEYALFGGGCLAVVSSRGGQLLYLFDLSRGTQTVGPDNFTYYGEPYVTNARYVPELAGGSDVYAWLAGKPEIGDLFSSTYEIRRRGFLDVLTLPGGTHRLADEDFALSADDTSVTATAVVSGVVIEKRYTFTGERLGVTYSIAPVSGSASGSLFIETALSPDLREAVDSGRSSLVYFDGADTTSMVTPATRGVLNRVTGHVAELSYTAVQGASSPPTLSGGADVFALELDAATPFDATPAAPFRLRADLSAPRAVTAVGTPPAPLRGRILVRPDPARTGAVLALVDAGTAIGTIRIFDARGRLVRTLGPHGRVSSAAWDLRDENGARVAAGLYFVRAQTDRGAFTAKLAVAR